MFSEFLHEAGTGASVLEGRGNTSFEVNTVGSTVQEFSTVFLSSSLLQTGILAVALCYPFLRRVLWSSSCMLWNRACRTCTHPPT